MGPDSIHITCPSCAFSRCVPAASLPSAPVKVTCPWCRHVFSFNSRIGAISSLPDPAPGPLDGVSAQPTPGSAGNSSSTPKADATDGASGAPDIPRKHRDFAHDCNNGLNRATLCRKYKIPEEKFPAYLEFLKKKGLRLAMPEQTQPTVNTKPAVGKNASKKKGKNTSKKKGFGLFDRIENQEGALKVVRDAAKGFYLIGGIQILLGIFIMGEMLFDGIALTILAFFLHKFASRIAAILLLLTSSASLIITILNLAGITSQGGRNIWLAAVIVIASIRAVEATFRLQAEYKNTAPMPLSDFFKQHEELAFVAKALAIALGIIFVKSFLSGIISFLLPALPLIFLIGIRWRAAVTGADPMDLLREHLTFLPVMRSESERRAEIKPWATYALILVNVLIFYCFEKNVSPELISDHLIFLPRHPNYLNVPLSAFTAMYLHASSGHLWGNMTFLWVVGSAIERRVGQLKFLCLYHLTGFMGGIVFILVEYLFHGSLGHSLGASGAIAGIMGIFAVRCYFKTMIFPLPILGFFSLILPLSLKIRLNSLVIVALFFLSDLVGGLGQIVVNSGSIVGHWIHLGGMISGMILASCLKLNRDAVEERHMEIGIKASVSPTGDEEGERSLRFALAQNPENVDALVGMARMKTRVEATPEGKKLYEKAIGQLLVEHPDEVVEVYREYVAKYQTIHPSPSVTTRLIGMLLKTGETGLAIHSLEHLVEIPGLPPQVREKGLFQLATLLEFTNSSEAAHRYAQFAAEYPSSLLAERAREKAGPEVSPQAQASMESAAETLVPPAFVCPKCGHPQEKGELCGKCGVYFAKAVGVAEREFHVFRDHLPGGAANPAISKTVERRWAVCCHLIVLSGALIPFGNIFGPLAIWLWKRDQSEFIHYHGKTALNNQISFTLIAFSVFAVALIIRLPIHYVWLLASIFVAYFTITISIAAIRAHRGDYLRIPLCGEFVK
jgi:membrane associated rhomboid family serine protease/uncharacterized Tic20 family protein